MEKHICIKDFETTIKQGDIVIFFDKQKIKEFNEHFELVNYECPKFIQWKSEIGIRDFFGLSQDNLYKEFRLKYYYIKKRFYQIVEI